VATGVGGRDYDRSIMWSSLLSNEAIIAMVGHEAFARGMVYARNGQVSEVQIDPATQLVTGRVQGGYRDGYDTSVQLVGTEQGWTGHRGQCSCPVAQDCKHTAALLIVARSRLRDLVAELRPAWEVALDRLVRAPAPVAEPEVVQLGLEFSIERMPSFRGAEGRISLRIRPARRGHRGAWVRSGISWEELDYPSRSHPAQQRDLLLQIRTAAGAAARFALPRSPWLSLTEVAAGFWSLLADADRIGLQLLVEGASGRPPLITKIPAAMVLDATRFGGGLALEPTILVDGQPLRPGGYGLLGDPVHGLYLTAEATEVPGPELTLAQLAEPLTREQRRLLADATAVTVPAADEARFLTDYLPLVRRRAGVVSTDGSVELPPQARPVLELSVAFRPEHRVRLDWAVRYVGREREETFPLDEPLEAASIRDAAAEGDLARALPLPYDQIPLLADAQRTGPAAHVLLAGGEAAIFVDQVLPQLEAAGVVINLEGERVAYRQPTVEPVVEVAAAPTASADWFDLQIRVRLEGEVVPFEEIFVALNSPEDFLITDSGVYVPLDRPELVRLRALIDEARLLRDHDEPGLRINRVQLGLWDELVQLGVVLGETDRWLRAVRGLIDHGAQPEVPVPDGLQVTLRPYQEQGFRWLSQLWAHGLGGVLADDMGLGKTVQTLALICRARAERPGDPPFLVVAPTSVVSNWAAELTRFAPGLSVTSVEGSRGRRRQSLADLASGTDVVVTSYALLRLDVDSYAELPWAGMILDEAQFVKNHRGRTYAAARRVAAGFKLAITGTPLENSLMDLWSLLSLTAPGLFPHPERFAEYYRRPIERDGDQTRLAQLRRRVAPFMLRRTKEAVESELPAKSEQVVEVVLQPRHQRIYQTHLQRERQKVLGLIEDLDGNRFTILRSLTLLRQLSLDPVLVDERHAGAPASKIEVLLSMLDELVGEGHQALVFSQFTGFLDRVATRLTAHGVSHVRLDGRTRARAKVIERFRSGEARVFLISLKAGGFGLNLTEADYCFVLDPWWNPAAEAQAVDRAHRIGQQRPVMVYRLVAQDTIEEKVMDLKARKERLVSAVLGDDALGARDLAAEDIRELLDLPPDPPTLHLDGPFEGVSPQK
jgi:superfamily II DNA or RNA helicase